MLNLIILAILIIGLLIGLKRGFILQTVHMTGFIVAFIAAYVFYGDLAPNLKMWIPFPSIDSASIDMIFESVGIETAYYNAIAFAIIFFAAKILWHMIGSMLNFIAYLPILKQLNSWGGAILGLAEVYLIMFIILYIAALLPMDSIQGPLTGSILAESIVKHTPFLSEQVRDLWFTKGSQL